MINYELTNRQYHSRPELSSSDGKAVDQQSVKHWRAKKDKPSDPTPAMIKGSAAHELILTPEDNTIIRGPDTRRGNAWKELLEDANAKDHLLLTSGDYDEVQAIADAVLSHAPAIDIMNEPDAMKEISIFNDDPDTGLSLRCRPDWYSPSKRRLIDIKTTVDASPDYGGFEKHFYKYGYALQCAWYEQVLYNEGLPVEEIIFITVENTYPYCVQNFRIPWDVISYGRGRMRRALDKINRAYEAERFTTGWPDEAIIELPDYLQGE
tara:strand:+ start:1810 stop:2604 length:795 start_codon:yes stop_codon:yes gene_type:complete